MRSWRDPSACLARRAAPVPRGFTIVELLVVLGVLAALLAVAAAAAGWAMRRARTASTEALLETLAVAVHSFRSDVGYLPPVLADPGLMPDGTPGALPGTFGWSRDAVAAPQLPPADDPSSGPRQDAWSPDDLLSVQAWCSTTSLAEYLVGPGDRSQDGFGVVLGGDGALPAAADSPGSRELPSVGIRHPGADGVWGACTAPRPGMPADGRFRSRCLAATSAPGGPGDPSEANGNGRSSRQDPSRLVGPRIGPYLDPGASGLELGGLVAIGAGGIPVVARIGDPGWNDGLSRVILDPFGGPVVYYRRGHRPGDPRSVDRRFSLADVVPIRPATFAPGEAIDAARDAAGDPSASRAAASAEFALLSFGPDRSWHPLVRADPDGRNEDNVVSLSR